MADVRELNRMHYVVIVLMAAITALTPVYSAFAEIQATPILEPTPTPTAQLTATPESTDLQVATPGATTLEPSSMISPQAVTPTGDVICGAKSNALMPGKSTTVQCSISFTTAIGLLPTIRTVRPNLPTGYTASITMTEVGNASGTVTMHPGNRSANLNLTLALLEVNTTTTLMIDITVNTPADAALYSQFNATFNVCDVMALLLCPGLGGVSFSETVMREIVLEEGANYNFICTLSGSPVVLGGTSLADCQIDEVTGIGTAAMVIHEISSTMDGVSGWDVAFTDTSGSPLIVDPTNERYRLVSNETFSFQVRLTPTSCAPAPPLSVNVHLIPESMVGNVVGNPHTATDSDLELSYNAPEITASAPITGLDDVKNVPYSLTTTVVSDGVSFSFPLSVSGCGVWYSSVQMDPFVKDGDSTHVGPVPEVTNVTHNSSAISPSALENGLPLGNGSDPGTSLVLVSNHSFDLVYTIPANTPVGTYTSTITVTTSDAP